LAPAYFAGAFFLLLWLRGQRVSMSGRAMSPCSSAMVRTGSGSSVRAARRAQKRKTYLNERGRQLGGLKGACDTVYDLASEFTSRAKAVLSGIP